VQGKETLPQEIQAHNLAGKTPQRSKKKAARSPQSNFPAIQAADSECTGQQLTSSAG